MLSCRDDGMNEVLDAFFFLAYGSCSAAIRNVLSCILPENPSPTIICSSMKPHYLIQVSLIHTDIFIPLSCKSHIMNNGFKCYLLLSSLLSG